MHPSAAYYPANDLLPNDDICLPTSPTFNTSANLLGLSFAYEDQLQISVPLIGTLYDGGQIDGLW